MTEVNELRARIARQASIIVHLGGLDPEKVTKKALISALHQMWRPF